MAARCDGPLVAPPWVTLIRLLRTFSERAIGRHPCRHAPPRSCASASRLCSATGALGQAGRLRLAWNALSAVVWVRRCNSGPIAVHFSCSRAPSTRARAPAVPPLVHHLPASTLAVSKARLSCQLQRWGRDATLGAAEASAAVGCREGAQAGKQSMQASTQQARSATFRAWARTWAAPPGREARGCRPP